ncbi:MAG: hypothetical protein GY898_04755 [Proteobacteria bacterium]|nr:hypothetical protein [Pseudomonadota bacterium]
MRDPDIETVASDEMARTTAALFRWVRRSHPWRGEGAAGPYVGPSLGAPVLRGECRFGFGSGSPRGLVPNSAYRGPDSMIAK